MTLIDRHSAILNELRANGSVSVQGLSEKLNVSEVTIRKDLRVLEEQKLLFRKHGGASLSNTYASQRPVREKAKILAEEKNRIAKAAVDMIAETDSVILGSGTTVQAMTKYIYPEHKLNVITSSLAISLELSQRNSLSVIQLGGLMRGSSDSVVGPYAESFMDQITCGMLFLGVDGIDVNYGITTTNLLEARLNQRFIEVSQITVLLADSSKFGKRGFGKICNLDAIQHIITDANVNQEIVSELEDLGIKVTVV